MFVVRVPVGWIGLDICVNPVVCSLIPDDVFMIVPLPDPRGVQFTTNTFCYRGFVRTNDGTYGTRFHPVWWLGQRILSGRGMPRPYGWRRIRRQPIWMNNNDPVHVIGHHDVCAQFHVREMLRDQAPVLLGDLSHGGQLHFAMDDISKQAGALMRNHRDEIRTGLGVIVFLEPDGAAVMFRWVVFHIKPLP